MPTTALDLSVRRTDATLPHDPNPPTISFLPLAKAPLMITSTTPSDQSTPEDPPIDRLKKIRISARVIFRSVHLKCFVGEST
ncbi:unnamed protein product [Leptosia nina]|uniref:Uncharacterized protein n=1 Tax=Leptosia nina TaxID=320188 RepID=A0AAV1JM48_9NEOP